MPPPIDSRNGEPPEFGASGGIPRTVFSPRPGGREPPRPQVSTEPRAAGLGALEGAEARPGVNRLVDAAADLFDLVVYLRGQNTKLETASLRDKSISLIKAFNRDALGKVGDKQIASFATYAISATIDDAVLAKPWGTESGWHHMTLVGALGGEKIGGDRFFEILEAAEQDPRRFKDLIEFMYICLSLGFRGRFGRERRQAFAELDAKRTRAFRVIEEQRGGLQDRLSLRWRGVDTVRKPVRDLIPTWLAAAASVLVCAGLFVLFLLLVGREGARAVEAVGTMPFRENGEKAEVVITRIALPTPREEVVTLPPRLDEVTIFLEEEIRDGLVEVEEDRGNVRIRLIGETMFGAGEATVLPGYMPTLERVATALNERPGDVVVEGHTDSVPISTARFPSNFHLSEARAQAVKDYMAPFLEAPDRMIVEPRGATVPIERNDTREGRARNRRVEILLIEDGE